VESRRALVHVLGVESGAALMVVSGVELGAAWVDVSGVELGVALVDALGVDSVVDYLLIRKWVKKQARRNLAARERPHHIQLH
jgi:hypothetical protein